MSHCSARWLDRDRVARTARSSAMARFAANALLRARRRIVSRPIILMYHRVAELPSDPQLLAVVPKHFAEQLEILSGRYRPISLKELVSMLREHRLPKRAVVLTLDDGYADNLTNAKPLLQRFDVPASVFVATAQIGHPREFWWDELERLVLLPGSLPTTMRFVVDGEVQEMDLADLAQYPVDDFERDRWWHVEQTRDPGPRQRLYRTLYSLLHPLPDRQKQRLLAELRRQSGTDEAARPTHRTLTEEEIRRLAEGDLIDIGAHTVTHPALAALPLPVQEEEVASSKMRLEEILNRPITSFAYPHGSYTDETVAAVRQAGFACACSSDPLPVKRASDLFRLPRVVPRDWDGDAFERWLRNWIG